MAGQRIYDIDHEGQIRGYEYDSTGRLTDAYYPSESEKPESDFEMYQYYGLIDSESEYDQGQNYSSSISEVSYLNISGSTLQELTDLFRYVGDEEEYVLNPSQPMWREHFEYDNAGNMTQRETPLGTIPFEYDDANRLLEAGQRDYEYDYNGNLIQERMNGFSAVYDYDYNNRLIQSYSETPDFIGSDTWNREKGIQYTYDAFGRRVTRTTYTGERRGNYSRPQFIEGFHESYIYDGMSFNIFAEFGMVLGSEDLYGTDMTEEEARSQGVLQRERQNPDSERYIPSIQRVYGYSADLVARTEHIYANGGILCVTDFGDAGFPLPQEAQDFLDDFFDLTNDRGNPHIYQGNIELPIQKSYYHADALGSIRFVTGMDGGTKARYQYDAFGNHYGGHFGNFHPFGQITYLGP